MPFIENSLKSHKKGGRKRQRKRERESEGEKRKAELCPELFRNGIGDWLGYPISAFAIMLRQCNPQSKRGRETETEDKAVVLITLMLLSAADSEIPITYLTLISYLKSLH